MATNWEDKKTSFAVIDVRNLTSNFLPMILHKAQQVNLNNGICVVQSFEPKPLYSALEDLGFEHVTESIRTRIQCLFLQDRNKNNDLRRRSGYAVQADRNREL